MKKLLTLRRRRPRQSAWCAAALLAATALAGCGQTYQAAIDTYPEDIRLRHPISIREGERKLELFVGVNRGGLSPAQQADVLGFAHSWRHEGTGGMLIDIPWGTPNERASVDAVDEVRSILAAAGVAPDAIATRRYRPTTPIKFATVRLSYPKVIAEAGPCGLWPKDLGPSKDGTDSSNHSYWNFGCTQQRNLAAMVDNPADLVQARGETPSYAARRAVVLDKYRKGEATATRSPDSEKGKISDIGK
ncbi:MAG: CpaD family pilus assembly protein [Hyphomicrobiales bacterium]|nr:CpaD family pilus assembly protein [Hyphomicrobiales bacterium]MBV8826563.1 CpaD family pilus assembly protein [Hyphomicrobiales bacterium]MBV9429224.1 CpaD family pilus assembly protein [Bradyrhizobiaceae bacterium]